MKRITTFRITSYSKHSTAGVLRFLDMTYIFSLYFKANTQWNNDMSDFPGLYQQILHRFFIQKVDTHFGEVQVQSKHHIESDLSRSNISLFIRTGSQ